MKLWKAKALSAILVLSGAALLIASNRPLHALIDTTSFFMVLMPILVVMVCCALTKSEHWAYTLLALGLPLGLFGSMTGVLGMVANISDPNAIYPATAIMFLTILYGGIVSAVGYFGLPSDPVNEGSLPKPLMFLCLLGFLALMLTTAEHKGLAAFYSPLALSLFLISFGWTTLIKRKIGFHELAETSLFSSILTMVFGIILWLNSGIREFSDISVALNGLIYGLGIYICLYILSLSYRDFGKINVSRANWHWMEITAFLIFLLFAPETIREVTIDQLSYEPSLNAIFLG